MCAVEETGRYSVNPSIIAIKKACNVFIYPFGILKNGINGNAKPD
jgi:hypothetical protein